MCVCKIRRCCPQQNRDVLTGLFGHEFRFNDHCRPVAQSPLRRAVHVHGVTGTIPHEVIAQGLQHTHLWAKQGEALAKLTCSLVYN